MKVKRFSDYLNDHTQELNEGVKMASHYTSKTVQEIEDAIVSQRTSKKGLEFWKGLEYTPIMNFPQIEDEGGRSAVAVAVFKSSDGTPMVRYVVFGKKELVMSQKKISKSEWNKLAKLPGNIPYTDLKASDIRGQLKAWKAFYKQELYYKSFPKERKNDALGNAGTDDTAAKNAKLAENMKNMGIVSTVLVEKLRNKKISAYKDNKTKSIGLSIPFKFKGTITVGLQDGLTNFYIDFIDKKLYENDDVPRDVYGVGSPGEFIGSFDNIASLVKMIKSNHKFLKEVYIDNFNDSKMNDYKR